MSEDASISSDVRKTPEQVTEFERQQLKFFLSQDKLESSLVSLNLSLAWLPFLSEMKVVPNEWQLAAWVERNFTDPQAVRDVVKNLHFFSLEAANLLERRLNPKADELNPVLLKCWRLIIQHVRSNAHGRLQSDWFEIEPRIKRGEATADVFHRLAEILRPRLRLGKRFSFGEETVESLTHPSQLMAIDYEPQDWPTSEEVLAAWPAELPVDSYINVISVLGDELTAALEDATDAGVEGTIGFSSSDFDVPSVAAHSQNSNRSGFYPIVRVLADLWVRLASRSSDRALLVAKDWGSRPFRLMRRLALFAGSNPGMPVGLAADLLLKIPQGELFLTGSTVEVLQTIRARWVELSADKRNEILVRLNEGPPRDWFKDDAEIDELVDRARFDLLGEMARDGKPLNSVTEATLAGIRERWPQWQLREPEKAGFHIWHEVGFVGGGNATDFRGTADADLASEARRLKGESEFQRDGSWNALCSEDPDRALRGLDAAAAVGDWPADFWSALLWMRKPYAGEKSESRLAELLSNWPRQSFGEIVGAASWWLNEHAMEIEDRLLWLLWDRIADDVLKSPEETVHE